MTGRSFVSGYSLEASFAIADTGPQEDATAIPFTVNKKKKMSHVSRCGQMYSDSVPDPQKSSYLSQSCKLL